MLIARSLCRPDIQIPMVTKAHYQDLLQISVIINSQEDLNSKHRGDDSRQGQGASEHHGNTSHLASPSLPGREERQQFACDRVLDLTVTLEEGTSHLGLGHMSDTPPKSQLLLATLPALCEYNGPKDHRDAIKDGEGRSKKVHQHSKSCGRRKPLKVELKKLEIVRDLLAKVVPNLAQILLVHNPLCRPGLEP